MRTVSMSGSLRGSVGKKDAKKLRKEGLVPCVIYGGKDQVHFFTQEKQFKDIIYTPKACFVELSIDGQKRNAILQEIQYHPVSDSILHVDFLEFFGDKPVTLSIPVTTKGTSPGVLKGGKLAQKVKRVKVTALPDKMPEQIVVDITPLDINDAVRAKDLKTEDYHIMLPQNNIIVTVASSRTAVAELDTDAAEGEKAE